jgi:xanthine dehydrogenase accessory factor
LIKKGILVIPLNEITIAVKGAGEMASALAWRLYMANIKNILMLETDYPLAVRREVSFCEAVHEGEKEVEKVRAVRVQNPDEIKTCWQRDEIAVMVDPHWQILTEIQPEVIVDSVLAKKNLGTHINEAPLVVGLGPGFCAGKDVHLVIETNRGHNLGRIVTSGEAEPNTGIPGAIGGFAEERVLRAPGDGNFLSVRNIGDTVIKNELLGSVSGVEARAGIDGVLRGLIRPNSNVSQGLKIGDIDPRGDVSYCFTISDKARAIGGSVLEAILRRYNRR